MAVYSTVIFIHLHDCDGRKRRGIISIVEIIFSTLKISSTVKFQELGIHELGIFHGKIP